MGKKESTTISIGSVSTFLVLFAILGYFHYGSAAGALLVALIYILLTFTAVLGFIPFIGVVLYYLVASQIVVPWALAFTGLTTSWVIDLIFWIGLIFSAIMTILVTVFVVKVWSD